MSVPITELELSIRTSNLLRNAGIETIEQLAVAKLENILLGRHRSINTEIKEALALHQNHLDREIHPELWQFVLANRSAIEALREGRATIQLTLNLKETT